MMKETLCDAIKLEGGAKYAPMIKELVKAGIPVCGHIGLTPQTTTSLGGFKVQGGTPESAKQLIEDAKALEEAGCFGIVLEKIPATLAERVAKELTIPVIGIGAGGSVDGQVLVVSDMLGMTNDFSPRFLRRYADLFTIVTEAVGRYVEDVKSGDFPNEKEQY
jgi:3-methyl-2-oxobutanoate hydroxymethyltransferase